MPEKKPNVNSGLKNLAMLPSYFDYIFVHLRQKARLRPESNRKFIQHLARARPEKPGPTYNCGANAPQHLQYNRLKLPLKSLVYRGLLNSRVTPVQSGRNHSSVYLYDTVTPGMKINSLYCFMVFCTPQYTLL